ncbi:MAG: hypothetical protein RLP09_09200, partial [Sandaracinaceae bacterium]
MLGLRKTRLVWLAALVALAGCDDGAPAEDAGVLEDAAPGADTGPEADGGPPPTGAILARPSRSSTIAITDDDALVIMTNPGDGSISVFDTATNERVARLETGGRPSSVV